MLVFLNSSQLITNSRDAHAQAALASPSLSRLSFALSRELLRAAGRSFQRKFYEALVSDATPGAISDRWREVLYVLLKKKWPNRAEIVSENREIALMANEMKLLLHMVRRAAYERVTCRLLVAQLGWTQGMGAGDASLVLAAVLQQAKRLGHPLYVLYVDLATMFPKS